MSQIQPYDALLWNHFEGGTIGQSFTTANSGGTSGSAFNGLNVAGGTLTYVTGMHGNVSLEQVVSSGTFVTFFWNFNTLTTLAIALSVRITAMPNGNTSLCMIQENSGGGAQTGRLQVNGLNGAVRLTDGAGTVVHTGATGSVVVNQERRITCFINYNTGAYEVKVFEGDAAAPVDSFTGTSTLLAAHPGAGRVTFGRSASPDYSAVWDSLAVNDAPLGLRSGALIKLATPSITSLTKTNPTSSTSNNGTATIAWQAVPDAVGYRLYRAPGPAATSGFTVVSSFVSGLNYTFTGLDDGVWTLGVQALAEGP